ncbi:molybdenum cofactor guanylyltransferase [Algoriphagus vanfongensis]|uniref:molybdenum cofactor guanylyltransferase n=1 Tax=Algoriphagus vanfongensis TaxID=426371 RepID=UPI00041853B7|nr:molybdenum cofactor guanylyltransferase [Algoriphagus vanfongensis]
MRLKSEIAAYILCGGKSSRMGQEKGLVAWKGKSFLTWILEAIAPVTGEIFLVTQNEKYQSFQLPMVADSYENKGPVSGIYSALHHSKSEWNLILSCDIPAIQSSFLLDLIAAAKENESPIVLYSDGIHDYPLIAIYHKSLETEFEKAVLKNRLKLCDVVNSFFPKKLRIDPENQNYLANVNSLKELEKLTLQTY